MDNQAGIKAEVDKLIELVNEHEGQTMDKRSVILLLKALAYRVQIVNIPANNPAK